MYESGVVRLRGWTSCEVRCSTSSRRWCELVLARV